MDTHGLNWRGVVVFGLAVLTVIVLIAVIDDQPATLGINTVGSGDSGDVVTTTTVPGTPTTTVAGGASTTTTVKPGTAKFDPTGKPQLQTGSTGDDVKLVQQTLLTLGIYTGAVDGSYGAGTAAAVRTFQTQKGINPADGVVGPATWTALSTA